MLGVQEIKGVIIIKIVNFSTVFGKPPGAKSGIFLSLVEIYAAFFRLQKKFYKIFFQNLFGDPIRFCDKMGDRDQRGMISKY